MKKVSMLLPFVLVCFWQSYGEGRTPWQMQMVGVRGLPSALVDELIKDKSVELEGPEGVAIAIAYNRPDLLRHLIESKSVNVNAKIGDSAFVFRDTAEFFPFLYYAVKLGNPAIVRELLAVPEIDVNAGGAEGVTPLHRAIVYGKPDILDQLLHHPGIDVNVQDSYGYTPLHYAVVFQRIGAVQGLLAHQKIDVGKVGINGFTALDLAVTGDTQKNAKIKALMFAKGCHPAAEKKPRADLCALVIKSGGRTAAWRGFYWTVYRYSTDHAGANMPIDMGIEELRKRHTPSLVEFAIVARDKYGVTYTNELVAIVNDLFPFSFTYPL